MDRLILFIFFFLNVLVGKSQIVEDKILIDSARMIGSNQFIRTNDGGYAFCGASRDFPINYESVNGHIVKLDGNFLFQWEKIYSRGLQYSDLWFKDMVQLSDGGFMALATKEDSVGPSIISRKLILLRTDVNGGILYVKSLEDTSQFSANEGITLTSITDSTFYIGMKAGEYNGDAVVCKIDINANVIKANGFRGLTNSYTANLRQLIRLSDGKFLVVYRDDVWGPSTSINFLFLDDDLNVLNIRSYNDFQNSIYSHHIIQCSDSTITAFGQKQFWNDPATPFIMRLTKDAELIWAKRYLPSLNFPLAFVSGVEWNNSFMVVGTDPYLPRYIPYVLQLDSSGEISTSQTYHHDDLYNYILDVRKQNDSLIILQTTQATSNSPNGLGIAMTDSTLLLPCSGDDMNFTAIGDTLVTDSTLHISNVMIQMTDLTSLYQTSTGQLTEAQLCTSTLLSHVNDRSLSIYPNPAIKNIQISFTSNISEGVINLIDITGKVILTKSIRNVMEINFDLEGIVPAIYFLSCEMDGDIVVKKLIVQ